jgi:hypothetical protein
MDFACVYASHSKLTPISATNAGKKEQKLDFDYSGIISIDYWSITAV